jgi:hypothetical protein
MWSVTGAQQAASLRRAICMVWMRKTNSTTARFDEAEPASTTANHIGSKTSVTGRSSRAPTASKLRVVGYEKPARHWRYGTG